MRRQHAQANSRNFRSLARPARESNIGVEQEPVYHSPSVMAEGGRKGAASTPARPLNARRKASRRRPIRQNLNVTKEPGHTVRLNDPSMAASFLTGRGGEDGRCR